MLFELENPDLARRAAALELDLEASRVRRRRHLHRGELGAAQVEARQATALAAQRAELTALLAGLTVRTPAAGRVTGEDLAALEGVWVRPGRTLASLSADGSVGVLTLADADERPRVAPGAAATVRLVGEERRPRPAVVATIEPTADRFLPHPTVRGERRRPAAGRRRGRSRRGGAGRRAGRGRGGSAGDAAHAGASPVAGDRERPPRGSEPRRPWNSPSRPNRPARRSAVGPAYSGGPPPGPSKPAPRRRGSPRPGAPLTATVFRDCEDVCDAEGRRWLRTSSLTPPQPRAAPCVASSRTRHASLGGRRGPHAQGKTPPRPTRVGRNRIRLRRVRRRPAPRSGRSPRSPAGGSTPRPSSRPAAGVRRSNRPRPGG